MKRIMILISGTGSNLNAIINASLSGYIKGKIIAVLSNVRSAGGLIYASQANIPYHIIDPADFINHELFDRQLMLYINIYQPDLIVLSGYMLILSSNIVNKYYGMIINIHPSLLPKYPGLHTHKKVLKNGDIEHGSTIHFVDDKIDHGPIILQAKIPIFQTDNELKIIKRIKKIEHIIYPLVISWFMDNKIKLYNNQVWVDDKLSPILYQN